MFLFRGSVSGSCLWFLLGPEGSLLCCLGELLLGFGPVPVAFVLNNQWQLQGVNRKSLVFKDIVAFGHGEIWHLPVKKEDSVTSNML